MRLAAVVGSSGSGKTHLIVRLIAALAARGLRTAVIKHCPHGYDARPEGKDSQAFLRAGAQGVALVGPTGIQWVRPGKPEDRPEPLAARLFPEADLVLIEGGSRWQGTAKVVVRRSGRPAKPVRSAEDILAFVSDKKMDVGRPAFSPGDVGRIAEVIMKQVGSSESGVDLEVDGKRLPLNPFVQSMLANVLLGISRSLRGVPKQPRRITLSWKRSGHEKKAAH